MHSWEVLGISNVASRFEAMRSGSLTPLVGREEEVELLGRHWEQAKTGEGRVVLLSGEPGVGKSRITRVLRERLAGDQHTRLLYFCSAHHQASALYPFIDQLERAAGFERDDAVDLKLDKLDALLARALPSQEDVALLAELLSLLPANRDQSLDDLTPRRKKDKTFGAWLRQLEGLARQQPVLMVFEDIHWMDPTSRELLDLAIERVKQLPALLLVTFRPEYQPPWIGQPHVATVTLSRLGPRESAELVERVVGNTAALPAEVVDKIVERADGVPLFVEELTKAVLEARGASDRAGPGVQTTASSLALVVPATLQASLMARLDRLTAAKEVAQVGAVFGREFSYLLLKAVARLSEPALRHGLQEIVEAGLASRRGTPPQATYTFKHALIYDTAYGMLLRARRRELHGRAAAALEDQTPELRERQPELLAHHYTQAGLIEPAIAYWAKAGHRSVARSAMIEAAAQLRQALQLMPALPDGSARLRQELELQATLGGALFASQSWANRPAVEAYMRAQELAHQLGDIEAVVPINAGLVTYFIGQGRLRDAREISVKLLGIAEHGKGSSVQLIAHRCMGVCLHWTGEFAAALEHFDRVVSLYDPARHRQLATVVGFDIGVQVEILSCWDLLILGHFDQALARFELAVAQCRHVDHKHTRALALSFGGIFSLLMQDQDRAFRQLTDAVALATEQHIPHILAQSILALGSVLTTRGDRAEGLAMAQAGYANYTATGAEQAGTRAGREYALLSRVARRRLRGRRRSGRRAQASGCRNRCGGAVRRTLVRARIASFEG